jgi:hypothetical protein
MKLKLILNLVLLMGAPLSAQVYHYLSLAGPTAGNNATPTALSQGYDFDVNSQITVTKFAVFDNDSNGLSAPFEVGLFDRSTGLLVGNSLTLTTANTTAVGAFRYADLAVPIILNTGFQGSIVFFGFNTTDTFISGTGTASEETSGLITHLAGQRYEYNSSLLYPVANTYSAAQTAHVWGSFEFSTIPEPREWILLLAGASLVFATHRRKFTRARF